MARLYLLGRNKYSERQKWLAGALANVVDDRYGIVKVVLAGLDL
jgi:hypothetical protein